MTVTPQKIMLLISVILFIVAAVGVNTVGVFAVIPIGLACFAAAFLLP